MGDVSGREAFGMSDEQVQIAPRSENPAGSVTYGLIPADGLSNRVHITKNGEPYGRALWPSDAANVLAWLESVR